MLFNSANFLFIFLPFIFCIYWLSQYHITSICSRILLVSSSLVFYSYWNWRYTPILLASILMNALYAWGVSEGGLHRKLFLITGIVSNLLVLAYFKYLNFFIQNVSMLLGTTWPELPKFLPLGVSFFTFTQIAYLVDIYRSSGRRYSLLDYSLFVTYFPHLPAGPIIHHGQMLPQFLSEARRLMSLDNVARGCYVFIIGLFKKVVLADALAFWVNTGYSLTNVDFVTAWIVSIAYSFQLYFDFSGYSDMAIGISLLFNIELPVNFNSPYKALNVRDFWRRWHITLSQFLRDYIYIPLGGNRVTPLRNMRNILLTFLLGGIWHGAGWNFVIWGLLHGFGVVAINIAGKGVITLPRIGAWALTFCYVNFAWIFFRAPSWSDAKRMVMALVGASGVMNSQDFHILLNITSSSDDWPALLKILSQVWHMMAVQTVAISPLVAVVILGLSPIVFLLPNSMEKIYRFKPSFSSAVLAAFLLSAALCVMLSANDSQFLYFEF